MNFNSFRYCLRQGFVSLRRNFWLAVVTASMIAISLAILGGFILAAINAGQMLKQIAGNAEISIFLSADAKVEMVRSRLAVLQGIEEKTFVSKEQGLADFGLSLGDSQLFVGLAGANNPLPDMFRVRAADPALVPALAEKIRVFPGVELVDYGEELISGLLAVTRWLNMLF